MKTYDDYLNEVKMLAEAGHNRSDVLKSFKTLYLLNDGDCKPENALGIIIEDIENNKYNDVFKSL